MSDSTFLHIQARGSSASRVMELTGGSVRVGGGAQCEARLMETSRPEVLCVIRRRGEGWQVQPLGPPGRVAINGIPIERPRPLPFDVPLRVGGHILTLHIPDSESPNVGSFRDPIAIIPESVETEPVAVPAAGEVEVNPPPRDTVEASNLSREEERLARWQASLERRERWLKARREERKWEHRWRAAGERLRARSSAGGSEGRLTTAAPKSPPRERSQTVFEAAPTRRAVEPSSKPAEPAVRSEQDEASVPKLGSVTRVDSGERDHRGPTEAFTAATSTPPADSTPTDFATLLDPDHLAARQAWEQTAEEPPIDVTFADGPAIATEPNPEVRAAPTSRPAREESRHPIGIEPLGLPSPKPVPEADPTIGSSPTPIPPRIDRITEEPSWPSARAILEAHRTDAAGQTRPRSRHDRRPTPTEAREPEQWSLPTWWTVPPALALTLLFGGLGLVLAWTWGLDDRTSAILADRLLNGLPIPAGGIEVEPLANPSWWSSTADHLFWRAAALGRIKGDPARLDKARFLVGLAGNASPLHPGVRYASAVGVLREEGSRTVEAESPLLSRDVVTLDLAARQSWEAGQIEESLAQSRQALELAASADPAQATPPRFDESSGVQRSLLPNEDLILPIIRDLAERTGGGFEAWSSALPDSPIVLLSAYRVLREEGSPEADRLLDRLLEQPKPIGAGLRAAVDLAARAEAAAFRERWTEAEQGYLEVIDHTPEAAWRRVWWRNLANVYARLDDLGKMEAARANAETGAARPVAVTAFPTIPGSHKEADPGFDLAP